jgi:hypothetical protein
MLALGAVKVAAACEGERVSDFLIRFLKYSVARIGVMATKWSGLFVMTA